MKTNQNFKISKPTKRMLALMPFADATQRTAFKHMMIESQVNSAVKPTREKKQ